MKVFNPGGGSGGSNQSFPNSEILKKIRIDSFGDLYYESNYNPDYLKAGSILALLGSLNDESGYSNLITPSLGQQNPSQIIGIDGQPALSLITNKTELSIPNIPSLLANSSGATLYAVFSNSTSGSVQHLIKTIGGDDWWRFHGNGRGYFGTFRSSRLEGYPLNMPAAGNFLISIHSRINDYEIFINGITQGVVGGGWYQGDRFIICPYYYECLCNLSLLLVIPFWVDKNSLFHTQKMQAIKGRFPSLPFVV